MDNYAVNLQDKIQKLIDQYTIAKKRLEQLELEHANLSDSNNQFLGQLETTQKNLQDANATIAKLEFQVKQLEKDNTELKKALEGFETITTDAMAQLDKIFPELEEINL